MIPHSLLGNDQLGSGVRDRVTACRKRLRVNRVNHRAQGRDEPVASVPEPPTGSEFPKDFLVMRQSIERDDYSPALVEGEPGAELLLIGTQEVGIT